MTRPILIIRPEPGNAATQAAARKTGLNALAAPLFEVAKVRWFADPPEAYVGVLLTSANAVRHAGPGIAAYFHLPAFAVGSRTAEAAEQAGFVSVVTGEGDVARLVAHISTLGLHRLLHLSGEDVTPFDALGIEIDRRIVYRSVPCPPPDEWSSFIQHQPVILAHSARAAQRLAQLVDEHAKGHCVIVTISRQVADAAGKGWEKVAVADKPRDEAMLEAAALLCRQ